MTENYTPLSEIAQLQPAPPAKPRKIYSEFKFVDDNGVAIYQLMLVSQPGSALAATEGTDIYFAICNHLVSLDGRVHPDQFRVDIPAKTIAEAFELLPGLIEPAQEKRMQQIFDEHQKAKKQIVIPDWQRAGGLPPAGKPKTKVA